MIDEHPVNTTVTLGEAATLQCKVKVIGKRSRYFEEEKLGTPAIAGRRNSEQNSVHHIQKSQSWTND